MIEQPPRTIYMYDRANWDALREELHVALTTSHDDTLEGTDVEQLWSKFKSSISQVVNKYVTVSAKTFHVRMQILGYFSRFRSHNFVTTQ